jgi:hypothetical protein
MITENGSLLMSRWQANSNPQHTLPGLLACAYGTARPVSIEEQSSKPSGKRRD